MALIFNIIIYYILTMHLYESMSIHFTCLLCFFAKLILTKFFIITSIRANSTEPFCIEHLPISNLMKLATNRHPVEWHNKFNFFYIYGIENRKLNSSLGCSILTY